MIISKKITKERKKPRKAARSISIAQHKKIEKKKSRKVQYK